MLKIKNLKASINGKEILDGIDLEANAGECILVTGHNGSGKSTLLHTIMGRPDIDVDGEIEFNGEDVLDMECFERSRNGFFIAHQSPPTLDGVNTLSLFSEFAKFDSPDARKIEIIRQTKGVFKELSLPEDWTQRDFNHGASGGERKKNELAQAKLKTPRVLLLDEPDSGLEQSSRSQVTDLIKSVCDDGGIVFLVTHDQLLQDSYPTKQIELSNGQTL
jgi:Fe-S cluster assembly ATP-binding protein